MSLRLVHVTLEQANAFVDEHHRHHEPVTGHRFSIGAVLGERLVGVAIIGRPVARRLDQRLVVEVNRCCTDGTRNACSFLYGAAARAAQNMGFYAMLTYTLDEEGGGEPARTGVVGRARTGTDEDVAHALGLTPNGRHPQTEVAVGALPLGVAGVDAGARRRRSTADLVRPLGDGTMTLRLRCAALDALEAVPTGTLVEVEP